MKVSDRDGKDVAQQGIDENAEYIRFCAKAADPMRRALFGLHASFTLNDELLARCAATAAELIQDAIFTRRKQYPTRRIAGKNTEKALWNGCGISAFWGKKPLRPIVSMWTSVKWIFCVPAGRLSYTIQSPIWGTRGLLAGSGNDGQRNTGGLGGQMGTPCDMLESLKWQSAA